MHRAEGERRSWHEPLRHHQEQEEHSRTFGAEEVQPVLEENDCPQRNQII